MLVNVPRIMLPELEKHRFFSMSVESNRARKSVTTLMDVSSDPFEPIWTLDQKGMSGQPLIDADLRNEINEKTCQYFKQTKDFVNYLIASGIHKQNCLRFLEPFQKVDVIITATESVFNDFFNLRKSGNELDFNSGIQPEMQMIALGMFNALKDSTPQIIQEEEWHLPYCDSKDREMVFYSAGRCATISYGNHNVDKGEEYFEQIGLKLISHNHMVPFEHQVQAEDGYFMNKGFLDLRVRSKGTSRGKYFSNVSSDGFVQARKVLECYVKPDSKFAYIGDFMKYQPSLEVFLK